MAGDTFPVEALLSWTIRRLKGAIEQSAHAVPRPRQFLYVMGRENQLVDTSTVQAEGLEEVRRARVQCGTRTRWHAHALARARVGTRCKRLWLGGKRS
jgi:hypothetical protein